MNRILFAIGIMLTLISSAYSVTTAFICKGKNGEKVFSQQPCGKDETSITITSEEPKKEPMPGSAPLSIGMTQDEVIKLWGRPYSIHKSLYASGLHEQWVYVQCCAQRDYVYFENDKLTAVQLH